MVRGCARDGRGNLDHVVGGSGVIGKNCRRDSDSEPPSRRGGGLPCREIGGPFIRSRQVRRWGVREGVLENQSAPSSAR